MTLLALRIALVAGASAAAWSVSPAVLAQPCRSGPEACKPGRKPLSCPVDVVLTDANGRCTVSELNKQKTGLERHQVQACVGDTVTWTFKNNDCGNEVKVEIGNFRLDETIIARHIGTNPKMMSEEGEEVPFTGLTRVTVPRGGRDTVTGVAKGKSAQTYKYDIIQAGPGRRRVILDPEVELYP
jgi:hypothetical protein